VPPLDGIERTFYASSRAQATSDRLAVMPISDDEIVISIRPATANVGERNLIVRVSGADPAPLRPDLEAEGIATDDVLELSAGDVVKEIFGFFAAVGGLGGVATGLRTYFHRNSSKHVTVEISGKKVETSGLSDKETAALIDRVLDDHGGDR
jgi:hypothetical protein